MVDKDFDIDRWITEHSKDDLPEDKRRIPMKVWICYGCFAGTFRFPPFEKSGRIIDQGIDFDDDNKVRKFHRCPKTGPEPASRRGNWHEAKFNIPEKSWDKILGIEGVERGPMRLDNF